MESVYDFFVEFEKNRIKKDKMEVILERYRQKLDLIEKVYSPGDYGVGDKEDWGDGTGFAPTLAAPEKKRVTQVEDDWSDTGEKEISLRTAHTPATKTNKEVWDEEKDVLGKAWAGMMKDFVEMVKELGREASRSDIGMEETFKNVEGFRKEYEKEGRAFKVLEAEYFGMRGTLDELEDRFGRVIRDYLKLSSIKTWLDIYKKEDEESGS